MHSDESLPPIDVVIADFDQNSVKLLDRYVCHSPFPPSFPPSTHLSH